MGVGCGEGATTLAVDLRTDFVAGVEVSRVETELFEGPDARGDAADSTVVEIDTHDDLVRGRRIASFESDGGERTVRARLLSATGALLGEGSRTVRLSEDLATTVVVLRGPRRSCVRDSDCEASVECSQGVCLDGVCLERVDHGACDGGFCVPDVGCVNGPVGDAGTCTPAACDDGDPCTADSCGPTGACEHLSIACGACTRIEDCGTVETGEWSDCAYADACTESGSRSRTITTPTCNAGTCGADVTTETEACSRTTGGDECGPTTLGSFGACAPTTPCGTGGTQARTNEVQVCRAGTCTAEDVVETAPCSVTAPRNGTQCGATIWEMCCGGSCVDARSDAAHCGSCRQDCSAIGLSCGSVPSGGYGCLGCTRDIDCKSILDSDATCYDVASPPATCQCQCNLGGPSEVCADAGCGANFFCHDCPGLNFCAPTNMGC
jgi:hypothetical protein